MNIDPGTKESSRRTISPYRELGAYEELWSDGKASFKTIADKFAAHPGSLPSDFVFPEVADSKAEDVCRKLRAAKVVSFGIRVHGAAEYPNKLLDARHPVKLLYFQGWWDLIDSRCIAVVGTREPSPAGRARTRRLVKALVADNFTIVSGLAKGVDTIAHTTALEEGGRTIAVIGTPLSHSYPKDNRELQDEIGRRFLIISQVPVLRYESQDYRYNRQFFPERNKTMSALTEATVIVEAGKTSGTLVQARAALEQQRKLFVLDSCFQDKNLTWPEKLATKGAIRVRDYEDIQNALSEQPHSN
ncbi:MAG: DNA-protecting protein DprA [Albidovulum sp.]|nr:DNA-protecting protein DprA [Albidovulum sp.]